MEDGTKIIFLVEERKREDDHAWCSAATQERERERTTRCVVVSGSLVVKSSHSFHSDAIPGALVSGHGSLPFLYNSLALPAWGG